MFIEKNKYNTTNMMHLAKVLGIWLHVTSITNIKYVYIKKKKMYLLFIGGGRERALICYILKQSSFKT